MKVYVASQTHHAEQWLEIGQEWRLQTGHQIISSWPQMVYDGVPESTYNSKVFWQKNVSEIQDANVVLVFADTGDVLRGALVEVGVALATEIPIVCVGDHTSYGTWRHHPLVYNVDRLADVIPFLDLLAKIHG